MPLLNRLRQLYYGAIAIAALVVVGLVTLALAGCATAARPDSSVQPPMVAAPLTAVLLQVDNAAAAHQVAEQACQLCHAGTDAVINFASGEALPAQVDLAALAASAHGHQAETPLACTDCHRPRNDYQFPHPPVTAEDLRAYQVERAATCLTCHQQPHLTSHPENVVCTDCHGAHDVLTVEQWLAGEGTAACVNCHTQVQAGRTNPQQLTALIRNGLFADQNDNTYCLACHSQPDLALTFANGDRVSLTIDAAAFHDSVHGLDNPWQPLACTDCHENYIYPHPPVTAASAREYTLTGVAVCANCHQPKVEQALDSVHAAALAADQLEAAVCTDCHGAHDTPPPDEPRERISYTCGQCHGAIFEEYATSVHGGALLSESNPDVPTCVECHGVHNIHDPTTALFRIRSPQLCAQCHADPEMMAHYDISTDVFDTYVADFHGTTVTLFAHQDPTVETNKAVCYDCHGVHDIRKADDPHAGIKANLLQTCQECHPDATANFPDAWTSHFRPSLQHNPMVYLVNLFYTFFIPAVLGFLSFLVLTDVYRRVRLRLRPVVRE